MSNVKTALKALRMSQPFNYLASSSVRLIAAAVGVQPEFAIKHLPKTGLVKTRLPNGHPLKLWGRGDDWVSNQIYWRGWDGYEPEASQLFFRLARQANITFDIGAHVGFYALLAAHANPVGNVYAFEPLSATFNRLQRNVELNRLTNVQCINSAVGEVDAAAEFYRPKTEIPCSGGLSFDCYQPWASEYYGISVKVMTGDRFVQEQGLDRIDLVKIDTETTEPQVLRGMVETLKRDRPVIFCEVLEGFGSEQQLEEILAPIGYHYYLLTADGPVHREQIQGDPVWLNYLFTPLDPKEVVQL